MREFLKRVALGIACVAVFPRLVAYWAMSTLVGGDHALEGTTQSLARVPGLRGEYLRRAALGVLLTRCHPSATICWGTVLSKAGTVIDENVYVGAGCHLGLVHLQADVLLASGVHIPSGSQTHGTEDASLPIRDQPGRLALVTVGRGTWVGSSAVVMADVGVNCIVAAGAVVTRPIPDHSVAAGVPARVVKTRPAAEVHG